MKSWLGLKLVKVFLLYLPNTECLAKVFTHGLKKELSGGLAGWGIPQVEKGKLGILERNLYNQNNKIKNKNLILKDQILKVLEINPAYGYRRNYFSFSD